MLGYFKHWTMIQKLVHIPSSIQVIPNDHISAFPLYWPSSIASITSGAIQYGVPTNELAGHTNDAEPKSAETSTNILHQFKDAKTLIRKAWSMRDTGSHLFDYDVMTLGKSCIHRSVNVSFQPASTN